MSFARTLKDSKGNADARPMSQGALAWWRFLCGAAALNVALWAVAAWQLAPDPQIDRTRQLRVG